MAIEQAEATDLPSIRQLIKTSRHLYQNVGDEDLAGLLKSPIGFIAAEEADLWGFLHIQPEDRPATLPADAPDRAHLRILALASGRSPSLDVVQLFNHAAIYFNQWPRPLQLIVIGGATWLIHALPNAGFTLIDQVKFLRLERLHRHPPFSLPHAPSLRSMYPTDLDEVAVLDAATFDALWHMDRKGLWQLMFTYRMQVALQEDKIVGYSAVRVYNREAQLARLAVHPAWQGQGIGRQLLLDALNYAQVLGAEDFSLNTQASNQRSLRLYQDVGLRPTGAVEPVFTRLIHPTTTPN